MAIIRNPMSRTEFAAAVRAVDVEDSEENRRHFRVVSRRILRGSIGSNNRPVMKYTGFHNNSRLYGADRCLVDVRNMLAGSPTYGRVIVLYVCDYSRKLAKRLFICHVDSTDNDRILDSFETIVERDATDGARMMA